MSRPLAPSRPPLLPLPSLLRMSAQKGKGVASEYVETADRVALHRGLSGRAHLGSLTRCVSVPARSDVTTAVQASARPAVYPAAETTEICRLKSCVGCAWLGLSLAGSPRRWCCVLGLLGTEVVNRGMVRYTRRVLRGWRPDGALSRRRLELGSALSGHHYAYLVNFTCEGPAQGELLLLCPSSGPRELNSPSMVPSGEGGSGPRAPEAVSRCFTLMQENYPA